MRLLKSFLLGTIASSVLGQDTPVCPEGWAIGQNKCYKEIISKLGRIRLTILGGNQD